jgi:hypothetical protein
VAIKNAPKSTFLRNVDAGLEPNAFEEANLTHCAVMTIALHGFWLTLL